jgi:hypothetical protein
MMSVITYIGGCTRMLIAESESFDKRLTARRGAITRTRINGISRWRYWSEPLGD